jgi:hypothetical protein
MSAFRNASFHLFAALLALLVFSGDVLDDVYDVSPAKAVQTSHAHGQQQGPTKCYSHHDTAHFNASHFVVSPPLLGSFVYFDVDQKAPLAEPPTIDHPPQLA